MIAPIKLFGNPFSDETITPTRLFNFGTDTLNRLTNANTGGIYAALIALLTAPLQALDAELGDVDVALAVQKGTTLTNDQVMETFGKTLSSEEPFIARAVGGKGSALYLQFYPRGISEYTAVTKTSMPTLTNRINVAATANAVLLGAPLTATLQAFETAWANSRNTQEQQMGSVGDNRAGRSDARAAAELVLLTVVHTIAAKFPGDVQQCSSFFNFNLLFALTKHKHKTFASPLAPAETATVANRTFTNTARISLHNPDDNAPITAWLSATANGMPPAEEWTVVA